MFKQLELVLKKLGISGNQNTGNVAVRGDLSVGDDLTVTDDAAVGGDLTVTGGLTVGGALTVTGNITCTGGTLVLGDFTFVPDTAGTGLEIYYDETLYATLEATGAWTDEVA